MMRVASVIAAGCAALLVAAAATGVAPGAAGSIVYANGDALGRGSTLQIVAGNGVGVAHALTARSLGAAMPAVAPDGKRVAFASLAPNGGGIYVLTLASRALQRVTSTPGDVDPAWSPDGKQLVFARRLAPTAHQLMTVAAAGGTPAALAGGLGRRPDFAPDGTRIVFQRDGKQSGIAVIPAAGGTAVALGTGSSPSWSPDGTTIALVAPVSRVQHLLVESSDGSGRRDITHVTPVSQPAWSPDGKRIVFVTTTAVGTCCGVATVDTNGLELVRVTHGLVFASRPAWAPAAT